MTISSIELLATLRKNTVSHQNFAQSLLQAEPSALLNRPGPDAWNAVECLEHLNRYFAFYLPELESRIGQFQGKTSPEFKSGWLGNYLAQSMLPKEKLNRMKTFKSMDPMGSGAGRQAIEEFIGNCERLIGILKRCETTDLSKVKTSISLTSLIKLRLGDTLRFLVNHNERHIVQAGKALN